MKNFFLFTLSILTCITISHAEQPLRKIENSHVREIFQSWNNEKGDWLFDSMSSFIVSEELPERPSVADKTIFQYLSEFSDQRKTRVLRATEIALEREKEILGEENDAYFWEEFNRLIHLTDCSVNRGRSNGDPHMTTFDGERYDFQTAGEYSLTKTEANRFEIQTQQVRHNENISVNGAAVIYTNGDVVSYYAQNFPDELTDQPIRINGKIWEDKSSPVFLSGGAVLKYENLRFLLDAPTGEQVQITTRTFQQSPLLDIDVFSPSCNETRGLLGNSDGEADTDIVASDENNRRRSIRTNFPVSVDFNDVFGPNRRDPSIRQTNHDRADFISREFGNQFLVDDSISFFERPMGILPPEIRYPEVYLTLDELTDEQIEEGLEQCKAAGIEEEDLVGCVYDYGYVGLEPIRTVDYVAPNEQKEPGLPENEQVTPTPNRTSPPNRNRRMRRGGVLIPPAGNPTNPGTGVRTPTNNGNNGGAVRTPTTTPTPPRGGR